MHMVCLRCVCVVGPAPCRSWGQAAGDDSELPDLSMQLGLPAPSPSSSPSREPASQGLCRRQHVVWPLHCLFSRKFQLH
jgi:hypothetical protein